MYRDRSCEGFFRRHGMACVRGKLTTWQAHDVAAKGVIATCIIDRGLAVAAFTLGTFRRMALRVSPVIDTFMQSR